MSTKYTLTHIVGAFRLLGRRASVIDPDTRVWADAGVRAATTVSTTVVALAHADETADAEARKELCAAVSGLRDGRIDREDLEHLARAKRLIEASERKAHQIGEIARA